MLKYIYPDSEESSPLINILTLRNNCDIMYTAWDN